MWLIGMIMGYTIRLVIKRGWEIPELNGCVDGKIMDSGDAILIFFVSDIFSKFNGETQINQKGQLSSL